MPQQQRLSDAIDAFTAHRKAQGYAANTMRNQNTIFQSFLRERGNIYVASVEFRHLDEFFAAYEGRWSPATMNLARTHLRTFFRFCRTRGWMRRDFDPLDGTRPRTVPSVPRNRVPVEDFNRLLDATDHPRDRMVIALGLFLFLRASEIRTLRRSDVDLDHGEIRVIVHKAGGMVDLMPIAAPLRDEFVRWFDAYALLVGRPLAPDDFLIPRLVPAPGYYNPETRRLEAAKGGPIVRPGQALTHLELVAQRALEAIGHPTFREGCHTLRRSGARAWFDELADRGYDRALELVSAMLHHKQMTTTQIYLGINESRLRRDDAVKSAPMFSKMRPAEGAEVIELAGRERR